MKQVMLCVLMSIVALGLGTYGWAEDAAVKAGEGEKAPATPAAVVPVPAKPATATATTTALTPAERMGKVIETQAAAAEKLLKQVEEEMAKPEAKRDAAKMLRLKLSAAQAYLKIAQAAKADATRLKKEDRQPFLDQYERPNRDKAIALYLELAAAAQQKKDYRSAVLYYNSVLGVDPQNATAQAGIKAIVDEAKAAGISIGGSSDKSANDIKEYQKSYKSDYTGSGAWQQDWSKYGRPNY